MLNFDFANKSVINARGRRGKSIRKRTTYKNSILNIPKRPLSSKNCVKIDSDRFTKTDERNTRINQNFRFAEGGFEKIAF